MWCSKCKSDLPEEDFDNNKSYANHPTRKGKMWWCRSCSKKGFEKYVKNNPGRHKLLGRFRHLKHRYGITKEQYEQMLEDCDGKCFVCSVEFTEKGGSRICLDHDHSTGKRRSLICHTCNTLLGLAKDSIERLQKLITYLEKHK